MAKKSVVFCLIAMALLSGSAFSQKQLSDFINEAYQNSPLLKINNLQSQANLLDAKRNIAALQKPLVGAEVNYMLSPVYSNDDNNSGFKLNPSKNISDYYGYDLSATNGGLYRGIITLEQPMFNKQRIEAVNEQAALQNEILDNNTHLTKHQLERLVTEQYIICLQDIKRQDAVEKIQKIIQNQINVTQKLSANGLAKQSDYKLLQIELSQQQSMLQSLKDNYKIHLLDLYSTCGISNTTVVQLLPVNIVSQQQTSSISGFTKQFGLDSMSLAADQKLFNVRYKPTVSLYSSAGLNGVYAPDIYKRFGWEVGIRLTKTFFDGNQRKYNDSRTKLLQQSASINSDFFTSQNESRKNSLLQLISSIDTQTKSVQQQINEYDSLLDYYQQQIANGQSSVIEYITVLRSKASLQMNLVTLQTNRLLAVNSYNYWNW